MDDIFSKLMLAYILFAVGFLICVGAFFVCGHNAWVDGTAMRQYEQDCANAVRVKGNPGDLGVCYVGNAQAEIVRQENVIVHHHAYLNKGNANYTYYANITLPNNDQVSTTVSPAFGQRHLLFSGDCQVEVWNKIVTLVTVKDDTEETANNPSLRFHKDLIDAGLSILGAIAFGGLAIFFNRRDSNLRYS